MKNKLSWQAFLIYLVGISLPVLLLVSNYTFAQINKSRQDYEVAKAEAANRIAQLVDTQFNALEQTANEIYLSSWYKKSISRSSVYQKEFNIVRKMEIASDLMYKTTVLDFVEDILILEGEEKSVICKYGWFSNADKYEEAYCQLDLTALSGNLRSADLFEPVKSMDDRYCALSYPAPSRVSTSRIAILIKLEAVDQYLQTIQYDSFEAIALSGWGKTEDKTAAASGLSRLTRILERPTMLLSFDYPAFDAVYRGQKISWFFFNFTLALATILALSALFTWLFAHPLEKLFQSIAPGSPTSHRKAIEGLSTHISQITTQNEALRQEMGRFAREMRGEILLRIMMGNDTSELDTGSISRLFPWLVGGKPYFLIIGRQNSEWKPPAGEDFCLLLQMPMGYQGCLCWQEKREACEILRRSVCGEEMFACSQVVQGMAALPVCYQEAAEKLGNWRQEIPLGDVLALLTHLEGGDEAQCLQVLSTYREGETVGNIRRILLLLNRWITEKGLPAGLSAQAQPWGDSWEAVEALITAVCAQSSHGVRRTGTAMIASVNRFINEHYGLPDLSLKYLASQFNTSVGALSRLYKQETGRNFSTVLLDIRMDRAKEMLEKTTQSIASVALAVGYENYLSFKRAFLRSEGMSPREYRDVHQA